MTKISSRDDSAEDTLQLPAPKNKQKKRYDNKNITFISLACAYHSVLHADAC